MADFVAAGELERRRVAEAIHDDSIQVIAAMGMRLQMLRRSLDDDAQLSVLDEAERAVQLSIQRLRLLVFELQPPGLDGEGVSVALAIALEAANREGGHDYRLDDQFATQPGVEEGAILFRVAQEALANVREHAQAATVDGDAARARRRPCRANRRRWPRLRADRSRPARPATASRSMRTRARLAGGSFASSRRRAQARRWRRGFLTARRGDGA